MKNVQLPMLFWAESDLFIFFHIYKKGVFLEGNYSIKYNIIYYLNKEMEGQCAKHEFMIRTTRFACEYSTNIILSYSSYPRSFSQHLCISSNQNKERRQEFWKENTVGNIGSNINVILEKIDLNLWINSCFRSPLKHKAKKQQFLHLLVIYF